MSHHGHGMEIPLARPRPRPQKPQNPDLSRESGAVRESVLDAAMQLGLGANPAVADWMFNNQLQEEDEDQIPTSPGLTYSEESPGSSPLSGRYPFTPSSPSSQNHSSNLNHAQKNLGNFHLQHFPNANTVPFAISSESHTFIHQGPDAANPPRPTTPSRLKKKRSGNRDGYDSDGGMLSDGKRKKDKKKDKKEKGTKIDAPLMPPVPPFAGSSAPGSSANSFLTIETTSSLTINDPRKRTTSLAKPPKSAPASPFDFLGYETDGSKKSKKKSKKSAGDNEKDVKKSRSLFFRLGNKSSKGDLGKERIMPFPVQVGQGSQPPPLPIADRFATTLNRETGAPMIALGPSGPRSPSNGSTSGSGLGFDLGLGLSGDMFSTSSAASSPPPRPKVPTRPRTADPAMSSPTSHVPYTPPLPNMAISHSQNPPPPPVSFPSTSSSTSYGPRPGSAGTTRTSTSTNTNTHSYSTGAARTSTATSVSTSQSHSQNAKGAVLSREPSNNDVPNPMPPLTSGLVSAHSVPPTPSKRRVLPFLGSQGARSSASSGDSLEKEKKREYKEREKERKKEKEKEREREKRPKKPSISLPLTRDNPEAIPASAPLAHNTSVTAPHPSVPNTPLRTRPNGSPVNGPLGVGSGHPPRPSHPPVSHNFQNGNHNGLSRQVSLSQLRSQTQPNHPPLLRQTSLTTLRPDGSSYNISPSPDSDARSTSSIPSDRTSALLRGPGTNGLGSPPSQSRLSGLPAPPNIFVHHDMPPPSPPPLSPLPSVPANASPVPLSLMAPANGANPSVNSNGQLTVNVGIAVTTGSPLPSPLLVDSPSYNSGANGTSKAPPTSFNPSSAAAGSALRARVQRRLSQQGGFPTPSASGANANSGTASPSNAPSPVSDAPPSSIPVIHAPPLNRGTSIRGRESPFPVLPLARSTSNSPNGTLTVNNYLNTSLPPRATSPRSGWEDSNSEIQSNVADEDDDGMEDVRDVIARFRESRIHDLSRKGIDMDGIDMVIVPRSFEAYQQSGGGAPSVLSSSNLSGNVPLSPSPSSNINGVSSDTIGGGYDSFVVGEYYGRGGGSGETAAPREDAEPLYDDYDPEDASHYPEDEMSHRRSGRGRSTVYLSDEEHDNSSNSGHGHGGGKGQSSRYSGSIYSRASFLDTEKSGEARQRFLRHVEAMLDERGERAAIPPVPKLPEEYVAESKRAAVAARKEYEMIMQKTIGVGARKVPTGSGMPTSPGR